MAHGDPIDSGHILQVAFHSSWKLLDVAGGTTDGQWVDVRGFKNFTVDIRLTGTATAKVCGSNEPTKPANTAHGVQVGPDIITDSMVSITSPLRWLKCRVSSFSSGTISAFATVVTP